MLPLERLGFPLSRQPVNSSRRIRLIVDCVLAAFLFAFTQRPRRAGPVRYGVQVTLSLFSSGYFLTCRHGLEPSGRNPHISARLNIFDRSASDAIGLVTGMSGDSWWKFGDVGSRVTSAALNRPSAGTMKSRRLRAVFLPPCFGLRRTVQRVPRRSASARSATVIMWPPPLSAGCRVLAAPRRALECWIARAPGPVQGSVTMPWRPQSLHAPATARPER